MWVVRCREYTLGSLLLHTVVSQRSLKLELKTPRCCLSCLSLLPANAPVPSNTDKYCPNPELSLYTETAEGMWLWIGFEATVVVMLLVTNWNGGYRRFLKTDVRVFLPCLYFITLKTVQQWGILHQCLGCLYCSPHLKRQYSNSDER